MNENNNNGAERGLTRPSSQRRRSTLVHRGVAIEKSHITLVQ